jgi:ketosteroid isomerase-like protein
LERLVSLAAQEPDVHGFVQAAAADETVVTQVRLLARTVLRDGQELPPVCADLCRRYGLPQSVLAARVWALASLLQIDLPGTESPHDVLEVPPGASLQDIKKAFRRLSLLHHPDRNPGDARAAARFLKIKAAYDMLVDPALQNGAWQLQASAWKEPLSARETPRRTAGQPGRWKGLWPLSFLVLILAVVVALMDVQRRPRVPLRPVEQVVAPRESLTPMPRVVREDERGPKTPVHRPSEGQNRGIDPLDSSDAGIVAYGRPRRAPGAAAGASLAVLERSAASWEQGLGARERAPIQDPSGTDSSVEAAVRREVFQAVHVAQAGKKVEESPSRAEENPSGTGPSGGKARSGAALTEDPAGVGAPKAKKERSAPAISSASREAKGPPAHPARGKVVEAKARSVPAGESPREAGGQAATSKKPPAPSRTLSAHAAETREGGSTVDLLAVEKRLDRFLAAYTDAYNRRDLNRFLTYFTEDARENGRLLSSWIEAYRENFQAIPAITYRIRPTTWSLDPNGDLHLRGRFQLKGTFRDGRPLASSGTLTMELVSRGDSFRVRALNYEFDPS